MIAVDALLPPGPRLPRIVQTLGFILFGARYLEACRLRYGGAVTMSTLFDGPFVMLFDPALVKQVFQGPSEQLPAGEANAMLGPLLGERSVLVLDGAEHLRHRRLMLPPFHGRRMQVFEQAMIDATDRQIDAHWPREEAFAVLPSMQALTLEVVMRAVFGFDAGPAEDELRLALRAMIEPITQRRRGMLLFALTQGRSGDGGAGGFRARRRAVDEILFAEIAGRRGDPDLTEREDVFSALLVAEDEDGGRLTDQEIRDELVTVLVAGHETTATALAWTLDLLLHTPRVLARVREAVLAGDDAYLDAVVKESLRARPIVPGGGTRRCLGASFALMEMRVGLRRILERTELEPASRRQDKPQLRAITIGPRDGVRIRATRTRSVRRAQTLARSV
jgi:cytochrome P450